MKAAFPLLHNHIQRYVHINNMHFKICKTNTAKPSCHGSVCMQTEPSVLGVLLKKKDATCKKEKHAAKYVIRSHKVSHLSYTMYTFKSIIFTDF